MKQLQREQLQRVSDAKARADFQRGYNDGWNECISKGNGRSGTPVFDGTMYQSGWKKGRDACVARQALTARTNVSGCPECGRSKK